MTTIVKKSNVQRVYEIILDDPGVSCTHITARLASDPEAGDITSKQVSISLHWLSSKKKIVNLGKHARGTSWFPAE